ncbi:MAG: RNA-binding S4 domain-containing protein [Oscillospiraceae bacterium]|jgi:ribosome-associated protein|nr:RNA-binding S4 domain-containing protein [Oscillospiraceae bacterium]
MKVKLHGIKRVPVTGEYIRLDSLLKFASVVSTGGEAKIIIQSGEVLIGGKQCFQRGRKIRPGSLVQCGGYALLVEQARL